ncbi:MAG: GGDEF domain-containing protein [Campylobacterota bacterium]|nr:GGDEF domain-containing protein [Campylobacterota bacterium]
MKNSVAKTIVTEVYDEIMNHINELDDNVDESEVIDFLHNIAQKLFTSSFHLPLDLHSQKLSFDDEYQTLASSGLASYKDTNDIMETIHQTQCKIIEDAQNEQLINEEVISKRFNDIQTHMSSEITRANETISDLHHQLRDLEKKSRIDPLTRIFNRQAMDDYMHIKCNMNSHAKNFHLLILDIDDFKSVNDTFGHIAGDKVLIFLANILKKTLRDGDPIFRYGGEEFITILNRTDKEGAILAAERILELVRNNKLLFKNRQMSITLSIGLAHCSEDDTPMTLIERADKALYEAKHMGKDQVQIAKG